MLPLVLGRATRLAQFYTRSDKIYEGVIRFGWSTRTYDRAGEPTGEKTEPQLDPAALERALESFRGEFLQTPPPVSAKKVEGRRAYELAREIVAVELAPVPVEVYELTLLDLAGPLARVARALFRRHVPALHRSRFGPIARLRRAPAKICAAWPAANSKSPRHAPSLQLESLAAGERLIDALVPAAQMLPGMASVFVDDLAASHIRNGRNFPASPFRSEPASRYVKAVTRNNTLVAIGEAVLPNLYHPVVVL